MGGHYGSIHVRTEDANEVRAALEEVARQHETKFLLAPGIGGWVTAFPNEHGQDFGVAESLAEKIKAPLLHCLVHDDDVFAYKFFEGGVLADQYNSCPDYFGGEPAPGGGDVCALRTVLPEVQKQAELRQVLEAERFDFETERLERFASILGLPNAVSAYEYLQDGERDGIKQWKQFVHIPDLTAERTAKRAAKAKVKAEMKRLAGEGILIMQLVGAKTNRPRFHQSPLWTINVATGEVLLMWSGGPIGADTPARLTRVDPRTGSVSDTKLNPSDHASSLAVSSNGQWLAVGCAFGDWKMQAWDLESAQLAFEIPQSRASNGLCFSRNGQTLFSLSEKTITVASGADLKTVGTIQLTEHGRAMAIHPQGEYLVVDSQGMLAIVHIPTRSETKTVWIDARPGLERELLERLGPQASARFLESLSPHVPASEMEQQQIRMRRHFLPKQGVFAMTFSPDGELLVCGTTAGVCIFDWPAVLGSPDMSPLTPKMFVEAEEQESEDEKEKSVPGHKLIYSVIIDSERNRVLFAGLEAKVRFLDLTEGVTGDLLVPPIRRPYWQLELTPDRTALVGTATHLGARKPEPQEFQIWSYPALCKAAGLDW